LKPRNSNPTGRTDGPRKGATNSNSYTTPGDATRRLKELEHENARLKRLLADAELDKAALKDLLGRKW